MPLKRAPAALVVVLSLGMTQAAGAIDLQPAWTAEGFAEPAAVVYDPDRDLLYVANVNGLAEDGDRAGFISKLDLAGTIIERAWVTGLQAPSGLALHGGLLYAADVDRLVAIDVEHGTILEAYDAAGAHTLSGIAVDAGGRVYAADPARNAIFTFNHGSVRSWLTDAELDSPNALLAEEPDLLVGTWGASSDALTTEVPGGLKTVDYATRKIRSLGGSTPIGNLTGIQPWPDGGYLITDGSTGALLHADPAGTVEPLLDLAPGAGALAVAPQARLIVIPLRLDNQVVAYDWR